MTRESDEVEFAIGCHGTHTSRPNDLKRPLWAAANAMREQAVRAATLAGRGIELVHGPENVETGPDEMVVLCTARDAANWVPSFVEHHLALGARHIFYLDNGSRDDTVELASRYRQVTVLRTGLSYRLYEGGFKRWLIGRYGRNRWSLFADADELFEYPHSDRLPLAGLLRYLRAHGYKALSAHMLDMFSDQPFDRITSSPDDDLRAKYRFYDPTDLRPSRDVYWIRDGQADDESIGCFFGGARATFFNDPCWCLTKHPLVYADRSVGVYRFDTHFHSGAPVADVSGVLLHYKYIASLDERIRETIEQGWFKDSTDWYGGMHDALAQRPDLCLRRETSRALESVNQLVDDGIVVAGDRYLRWVEEHGTRAAPRAAPARSINR